MYPCERDIQDIKMKLCGRSSVAERQLPKLYVVSSILIARSNFARLDNYVGRMVSYEHLIGKNEC